MQSAGPKLLLGAAMALPLLNACGIGEAGETAVAATRAPAPIPVKVAGPWLGEARAVHRTTTHLEPVEEARIVTRVDGEVLEILVEEGETVSEGEVLARLDGERLRLRLAEVKARLDQTRREYRRNVQLNERGLVSQTAFEGVRYEMEALESDYRLAKLELSYTELRAPFDAVVTERLIKHGNMLPAGTEAFRIANVSALEANLSVPQRAMSKFTPGQSAVLAMDALPEQRFEGTVLRVSPTVDPLSGTFRVTLSVPSKGNALRPGMFARADVAWDIRENALLVPRNAVMEDDSEQSVWVVRDGRAWRQVIRTGIVSDETVEILEGLDPADTIVVAGQSGLREGTAIQIHGHTGADNASQQENVI